MMGSTAAVIKAPEKEITFVEDLPEDEREAATMKNFSPGLTNLGNTCCMNSCLQCLYAVPSSDQALAEQSAPPADPRAPNAGRALAEATRDLFNDHEDTHTSSVTPFRFLALLRQLFPQFAQEMGQGGSLRPAGRRGVSGRRATDAVPRDFRGGRPVRRRARDAPLPPRRVEEPRSVAANTR